MAIWAVRQVVLEGVLAPRVGPARRDGSVVDNLADILLVGHGAIEVSVIRWLSYLGVGGFCSEERWWDGWDAMGFTKPKGKRGVGALERGGNISSSVFGHKYFVPDLTTGQQLLLLPLHDECICKLPEEEHQVIGSPHTNSNPGLATVTVTQLGNNGGQGCPAVPRIPLTQTKDPSKALRQASATNADEVGPLPVAIPQ
jgi:hypothetical protein